MSPEMIAVLGVGSVTALIVFVIVYRRLPKRLNQKKYTEQWRELQGKCKDKATWREAIVDADMLLVKALRKRKFKGKNPGERLVSAQRKFSDNDGVWFAHNLYKKLQAQPNARPKEEDVKKALTNFRQALRDLGALPNGK